MIYHPNTTILNTLRTGGIFLCPALLNVADQWHIIMILGHVMLKHTIPCSGATYVARSFLQMRDKALEYLLSSQ
jgi:hypothetical protein